MQKVDYYECLGITKAATHDEVKQAYRKLALVIPNTFRSIIPIKTRIRKKLKLSLPKLPKHTQVANTNIIVLNDPAKR